MSRTLPAAASPLPLLDHDDVTALESILSSSPEVTSSEMTVDATVIGLFPTGFYLGVDAHRRGTQVLPVMGPDALQLPTGLQVPQLTADHLGGLRPGMPATVTFSTAPAHPRVEQIEAANLRCAAVRTWRPSRIEPPDLSGPRRCSLGVVASVQDRLNPGLNDLALRSVNLVRALKSGAAEDVDSFARALLGYGPGSTPSGDDALCGIALALRWTSQSEFSSCQHSLLASSLVGLALEERTTAVSASLLRAALDGYCIPEIERAVADIARLIRAEKISGNGHRTTPPLHSFDEAHGLDEVFANISRIGHHSGHDLLTGFLAVLTPPELTLASPLEGTIHADDS
ncbi:DUF2877 domain-containing protein [Brevibacterium sp. RIT 803]|uniref:oxamate carbamoyltransferase subunit AllH family protein n=1 Tax=Brevibacterium sp. RIT 803 TaxID=2810210 RepID=UPI001950AECE|nr:DUF2877 domain-containing protein [Brevibacterium sp. RIT 803]MBM6591496.1 DUF2877 domain-containing protein [Brevibacterium sp. RIT 803]